MGVLLDDRHEMFAQAVVRGLTRGQAFLDAGFNAKNLNSASVQANKLVKKHPEINDRIDELHAQAREVILDKHFGGSVEELAKMLLDDREFARQQKQPGAAVSATAQLMRLFEKGADTINASVKVSKVELTAPGYEHGTDPASS